VGEEPREALEILRGKAGQEADLLLVSGGASGGAHDHTAELLRELGFEMLCHKVNCRPGKPLLIGVKGDRIAVGLPGNPVSHFVTFHVFVRLILALLAGRAGEDWKQLRLQGGTALQADPRETFWPAVFRGTGVSPLPWLDSGHLSALVGVDALIRVPSGKSLAEGDLVEVVGCGRA
jgi:molybdopterin molybdotransferase